MVIRLLKPYKDIPAGDYDRLDDRLTGLVGYLIRTGVAIEAEASAPASKPSRKRRKANESEADNE